MIEQVGLFLKQRGWNYDQINEREIATAFNITVDQGQLGFPLSIMEFSDTYDRRFLRMTSVPFAEAYNGFPEGFFRLIAQINHDLPLVRFALDTDDDLELLLDLPAELLTEVTFNQYLQMLIDESVLRYPVIVDALSAD